MKKIFKYHLVQTRLYETQHVLMPEGAEVLDVQFQKDGPVVWVLCNPDAARVQRIFWIFPTGGKIANCAKNYVATYQTPEGLVFHVFEGAEVDISDKVKEGMQKASGLWPQPHALEKPGDKVEVSKKTFLEALTIANEMFATASGTTRDTSVTCVKSSLFNKLHDELSQLFEECEQPKEAWEAAAVERERIARLFEKEQLGEAFKGFPMLFRGIAEKIRNSAPHYVRVNVTVGPEKGKTE